MCPVTSHRSVLTTLRFVTKGSLCMLTTRLIQRPWLAAALLVLVLAALASSACNTWKGAGKDVQRTGEKMQGD